MPGQLIVSISGIDNRTLDEVSAFRGLLAGRGVPASLLVAPRRKNGYRLDHDPRTVDWLTHRRGDGDAIVLHGFEGAATSPAHEANLRLMAADRVLDHLGLRTRLFAGPKWNSSDGTATALRRNGFRLSAGCTRWSTWSEGRRCGPGCSASAKDSWPSPGGVARWCWPPNARHGGAVSSGSRWPPATCGGQDPGRRCSTRSTWH